MSGWQASSYGPPCDDPPPPAYPGAAGGEYDPHRPPQEDGGGGGHTVVMVAQAVQPVCDLTRGELDGYLRESGYGKNEAAFACYFTRENPSAPPLCIACGHRSADHRKGPGQQQQTPKQPKQPKQQDAVAVTAVNVVGTTIPEVDPPSRLVAGSESDTTAMWSYAAFFIAAAVMIFIGLIQTIVFSVVKMPIYAMVGPVVVLVLGIGFLAMGKKTTVVFHTTQGSRCGDVDITTQRLVTWCCPAQRTVRVWELSNVRAEATNMRVNKRVVYEVVCDVGNSEDDKIALHSGYHGDTYNEAKLWDAYIKKLQQQG